MAPTSPITGDVGNVKREVVRRLEAAIASAEDIRDHSCTATELAQVLFQFGLTWKGGHASREAFRETLCFCVEAIFPRLPRRGRFRRRR